MSWGPVTATDVVANLEIALTAASDTYTNALAHNEQGLSDEAARQLIAARRAAVTFAQSSTVGAEKVSVTLSGHANPGHRPAKGWSNDFVTITVSNAVVPEAAPDASTPASTAKRH